LRGLNDSAGTELNRPRVLLLTPKIPAPGISGDRIRNFHLIRELARRRWRVWLFALSGGQGHEDALLDGLSEYCERLRAFPLEQRGLRTGLRMARAIATRRAFHRYLLASRAGMQELTEWTDDASFDAVLVSQLMMFPYVQPRWLPVTVLDSHNHEATRVRGIAEIGGSSPRRLAAALQVGAVRRYEEAVVRRVRLTLAVSPAEARQFDEIAPGRVAVVPNGVDLERIPRLERMAESSDIVFVGSLDYSANVDAVRYFMTEMGPFVTSTGARFRVVGSNPPRALAQEARGAVLQTEVLGFVDDLAPIMRRARVFAVPLRRGGGTRLKILEAMAWGVPVVTTSAGSAGLDLVQGDHALIEDEPRAFAAAIDRLMDDDVLWRRLSSGGRKLVEDRYGWHAVGERLDAALHGANGSPRLRSVPA